jgi:hypothetical protein
MQAVDTTLSPFPAEDVIEAVAAEPDAGKLPVDRGIVEPMLSRRQARSDQGYMVEDQGLKFRRCGTAPDRSTGPQHGPIEAVQRWGGRAIGRRRIVVEERVAAVRQGARRGDARGCGEVVGPVAPVRAVAGLARCVENGQEPDDGSQDRECGEHAGFASGYQGGSTADPARVAT